MRPRVLSWRNQERTPKGDNSEREGDLQHRYDANVRRSQREDGEALSTLTGGFVLPVL